LEQKADRVASQIYGIALDFPDREVRICWTFCSTKLAAVFIKAARRLSTRVFSSRPLSLQDRDRSGQAIRVFARNTSSFITNFLTAINHFWKDSNSRFVVSAVTAM
jgi:hypothetical protein